MQRKRIKKTVVKATSVALLVGSIAGATPVYMRADTLPSPDTVSVEQVGDIESTTPGALGVNVESIIPVEQVQQVKIYRDTNNKSWDQEQMKKFNINFHTSEPLGIEVLDATTVEVLITGDIKGSAQLALHDTNNLSNIKEIPVGQKVQVAMPRKGQLFLDVNNIQSTLGGDTPYAFDVEIILEEESYIQTPTFDVRDNKLSENVILDPQTFVSEVKKAGNEDNGMLMISDNVRLYFPQSRYVPETFDPVHVLQLHEDTIEEDNRFAGLDANDPNPIHHPRKNFVLVSARNNQVGYMSAGGQMLDTHPKDTKEYFVPGWGMYHEYGHLYEQKWSFIEIWNNMFSKNMTEQTIGFTWLWQDDRAKFEAETIKPFYDRYVAGEVVEKEFGFRDGLYFFTTLEEHYGKDFVATIERHWRENDDMPLRADYVAYAMAASYDVNVIPYLGLYGLKINDPDVYNYVIDNSKESLIIVPEHPAFRGYEKLSVPATVKGIYEGTDVVLTGIANKNSKIAVQVDEEAYYTKADKEGKFELTIPGEITINTSITMTTKDPGKDMTAPTTIEVKTTLSDSKFHLQGYGDGVKLILGFNPAKKVLDVTSSGDEIHYYFENQEYFAVEFYSADGTLRANAHAVGKGNANAIEEALNGEAFEYGDYIKIRHREPGRAKLYGEVLGSPIDFSQGSSKVDLATSYFYITPDGLEYSNQIK